MPLIVIVHRAADIRQVLAFARESGLKLVLSGAEEGWQVASEIAAMNVPVLLNPTSNIPSSFDQIGASLRNAAILKAAGVDIAISGNDGGHRVRDMRYNAGLAVSRGLPQSAALEAITLAPARIFGVANLVGSIEPGKLADLVIWDGDPLEALERADCNLYRRQAATDGIPCNSIGSALRQASGLRSAHGCPDQREAVVHLISSIEKVELTSVSRTVLIRRR
ncbi:MAG: amidohydrolase family protein [Novosphingobium sp.]|nr:amidohydrolase family protein [Novosphingobium sp.]